MGPPLKPFGRRAFGLAAAGCKLYAVGGAIGSGGLSTTEVLTACAPPPPPAPDYYYCVDKSVCKVSPTPTAMNKTQCEAVCHG